MTRPILNRRQLLQGTAAAVAIPFGCGDDSSAASEDGTTGSGPTGGGPTGGGPTGNSRTTGAGRTGADASSDSASATTTGLGSGSGSEGTTSSGSRGTEDGTTGETVCEATDSDIEGPFYRPGIPIRDDLDIHGDEGIALILEGQVLDASCTPLANAVVELWHASPRMPGSRPGDADATYDGSRDYRYYGQVATNARGMYRFTTLTPGWYLNGPQYRPAHLHIKVWVRDQEVLTTQLYFAGDPFNRVDPWFNDLNMLAPDDEGVVVYDFNVAR